MSVYVCGKRIETDVKTRRARVYSEKYSHWIKICSTYICRPFSWLISTIRANVLILFVYHTLLISSTHKIRHTKFVFYSLPFSSVSPPFMFVLFVCVYIFVYPSNHPTDCPLFVFPFIRSLLCFSYPDIPNQFLSCYAFFICLCLYCLNHSLQRPAPGNFSHKASASTHTKFMYIHWSKIVFI